MPTKRTNLGESTPLNGSLKPSLNNLVRVTDSHLAGSLTRDMSSCVGKRRFQQDAKSYGNQGYMTTMKQKRTTRHRGKSRTPAVYNPPPAPAPPPRHAPIEVIRQDFASRLQEHMTRKGWNQSELARHAALHTDDKTFGRDLVSGYLRGRCLPGPPHLHALSTALGVSREELLPHGRLPTASGSNAPPLDLRAADNGMAYLRVNQVVRMETALEIVRLLAADAA
jgi:transcriptional regulator with XRE-family HTH domain